MVKQLMVRLDDELAADTEALARADGQSLDTVVTRALIETLDRRCRDPEFRRRVRRILDEDRALSERLPK